MTETIYIQHTEEHKEAHDLLIADHTLFRGVINTDQYVGQFRGVT